MTNAIAGKGAIFKRGDGTSSESFTAIAEVTNVTFDGITRDQIDVTNLDSVSGYREKIAGFRDPGTVTLDMNWTLDTFDDFLVDFESDDTVNYQLVMPDTGATTFNLTGLATSLGMVTPTDDRISSSVTITLTGPITITS